MHISNSQSHADAFFGMDDLRELTELKKEKLPVYIRESDATTIRSIQSFSFSLTLKMFFRICLTLPKPREVDMFLRLTLLHLILPNQL